MITEPPAHIRRDDAGTAWIDDTGVKVVQVVQEHIGLGWSADTIYENHPSLSLAQIHAALAWYFDHQEEMEHEVSRRMSGVRRMVAGLGENAAQRRFQQLKAAATP